jgi:hypothetical protein
MSNKKWAHFCGQGASEKYKKPVHSQPFCGSVPVFVK